MAQEPEAAGTPEPEGGDAQNPETAANQAEDGRLGGNEAEDYVRVSKHEHLKLKEKAEKYNELERQNQELEARTRQSPAADAKANDPWAFVQEFAAKGDPQSQAMLDMVAQMQNAFTLQQIPADERKDVVTHFKANPHRFGDLLAARADLRAQKLEQENRELAERLKKMSQEPPKDVIRTDVREGPSAKSEPKITADQFDAEAAKILAEKGPLAELQYRAKARQLIKT